MSERTPRDLQGLLKFAMEATKSEDAPSLPRFEEMDEERKKFLEDLLNSMTVDTIEEFQKALEILQSDTSSDNDKLESMELLQEYVDNIDHANNFVKLGGAKVLISCLESNNANIKKQATSLIAELCQNNPFCQSVFGTEQVFRLLMNILSDDIASSGAMHAISCLVRHHEASLCTFIEIGGLECLSAAINSNRDNIVIKSCFLISCLASEFTHIRDKLIETGNIARLTSNLKSELNNPTKNESILRALLSLTRCPAGKTYLRKTNVEPILKQLIQASIDKPEFQEIEEYSKELLNVFEIPRTDDAER